MEEIFGAAPRVAIVLGSGFSDFVNEIEIEKKVATQQIAGATSSTVEGHKGELVLGHLKNQPNKKMLIVAGRVHGYEGNTPHQVVHILRMLRRWGISKFILTNASGSTSKKFKPGKLVLIQDQINFTGLNPLTGKDLYGGERFPDMSDLYSSAWRKSVKALAKKKKIILPEGVYVGVNGPSFETPAEIRLFAKWGAHMVGMSTVWESIALKQMGAEVLGLSCVTNYGTGIIKKPLNHTEVLEMMKKSRAPIFKLLIEILKDAA